MVVTHIEEEIWRKLQLAADRPAGRYHPVYVLVLEAGAVMEDGVAASHIYTGDRD